MIRIPGRIREFAAVAREETLMTADHLDGFVSPSRARVFCHNVDHLSRIDTRQQQSAEELIATSVTSVFHLA